MPVANSGDGNSDNTLPGNVDGSGNVDGASAGNAGNTDPDIDIIVNVFLKSQISSVSTVSAKAETLLSHEVSNSQDVLAFFELVDTPRSEAIEGFGLSRFDEGFVSVVGESSEVDYGNCQVVCKANSVDGTFEFAEDAGKYARLEVDINNSSLTETGLPHWVVEDTFEWVNSGMPSHLSQVYHSNISNFGIAFERSNAGYIDAFSPGYQSRFFSARNREWYDWFNSSVDFEISSEFGNEGLSLSYPNAVLYVESIGSVLVGGKGILLSINVSDLSTTEITVDADIDIFVKDLFYFNNSVYILDQSSLYIWDLSTNVISKDGGLGLPDILNKVVVLFSQNIVIGGQDGIYARKMTQDSWTKVVVSSAVDLLIAPDSAFAVANNEFWYSSEGFTWTKIGSIGERTVNHICKHRSQMLIGTNEGAYGDNGSLYGSRVSISLLNILNDLTASSLVSVNSVVSDFSSAIIGLSDGRYVIWSDSFSVFEDSNLPAIHKAIFVDGTIWLFGYDLFKIGNETRIRRLATGLPIE